MVWIDGFPAGTAGFDPLELLGCGSSSTVFKARQRSTGQFVAIKVAHSARDPAAVRRLQQRLHHEVRLCARLHHPFIVRLLDKGLTTTTRPYAVFEFLPGCTLNTFVRIRGPLPLPETVALMAPLLETLAWLHAYSVIHRDLKPQNIIVSPTGTGCYPKLLDFGIAVCAHLGGPPTAGEGTPAYCAPEQLRGAAATPAADIYAWGLMFVECLTGRPLLHGLSGNEARRWQLSPTPVPLPKVLLGHPLAALLRATLEKNVSLRASDAAALHLQLLHMSGHKAVAFPNLPSAHLMGAPQAKGDTTIMPTQ